MTKRKVTAATAAATVGLLAVLAFDATAQTAELRVLASNGVKAVIEDLLPQCERAAGRRLAIEFNSSAALNGAIAAGRAFDVAIVTSDLLDTLIKQGKIRADSRAGVARAGVGVGVRTGAPRPDITTPDALRRTLLNARSITYAQDGASRVTIASMFERFGITESMKPKTILEQGSIRSTGKVVSGDAELVITLVSEILPIQGIELVGPLPDPVQSYVSFAAGVGTNARDLQSAKALIAFLTGPTVVPAFRARGMEAREK